MLAGCGQRRRTAARSDERARVSAREPHRVREDTMSRRNSAARRDFVGVGNLPLWNEKAGGALLRR